MVVIEAAAITAGSIAAYQGGKAAASATAKSIKTKMHSHKQEKARNETFTSRKTERSERFARVNQYRESVKDASTREKVIKNFQWGSKKMESGGRGGGIASSTRTAPSSSSLESKKRISSSRSWRS